MKHSRREFAKSLAAVGAVLNSKALRTAWASGISRVNKDGVYDVAVIGAGVFGAWTAMHLQRARKKVVLVDAYGASNSRASSGGESRIIRMGYGADEIYTRSSMRSLKLWQEFFGETDQTLFHRTGVLWLALQGDKYLRDMTVVLKKVGVHFESFSRADLEKRYPQFSLGQISLGILEPESGVLMARRAVQTVVRAVRKNGVEYIQGEVATPTGKGRLNSLATRAGATVRAGTFVFSCGPWLPKVFPDLLGNRIFPTRQQVFFFGVPGGDSRFRPPAMPAWIFFGDEVYGIPDLENRGFKIAPDRHGPPFDPDAGQRVVTSEDVNAMRKYLDQRFPAMKGAPILETRVCQYENTSNGDFLIDRHPDFDNVWLVGGGSGHGFKHGPAVGEYVAARILSGSSVEPRFSLTTKGTGQERAVY
jgi:sarcosine oxidase